MAQTPQAVGTFLTRWVDAIQHRARLVIVAMLLVAAACGYYTAHHLSIDTATSNMLSAKLPWRQADIEMDRLFPSMSHVLVIVIDSDSAERSASAQARLAARLKADTAAFTDVYAPETEPFFRREGLLYLDPQPLQALADGLTTAQPFLGTLNRDPSLHGLFGLLTQAATNPAARGIDLGPAIGQVGQGIDAAVDNQPFDFSWLALMGGGGPNADAKMRFIQVNPVLKPGELLPAKPAIDIIHTDAAELGIDAAHGLRLRLTGPVALEHEELLSAASGAEIAFAVGFALVILLLFAALRTWQLVLSSLITLIYGLVLTAFFASVAIGHLNLISVAFGVLYIGLGIDYSLYLCMQYRDRVGRGETSAVALSRSAADIGGYMAVCAATTSIGFLAFIPTDFTGIAELGLISGAGVGISLIVSLTLLPALISLLPPDPAKIRFKPGLPRMLMILSEIPYRHGRTIWAIAGVCGLLALFAVPKARFDYDPLDLRDPKSESVSTFREMLRNPDLPVLTLSVLAPNAAAAKAEQEKLAGLPLVKRAMWLDSYVAQDQQEKLAVLDDLNLALGPDLMSSPASAVGTDDSADWQGIADLQAALAGPAGAQANPAFAKLQGPLNRLVAAGTDASKRHLLLERLRTALLGGLLDHLAQLRDALQAAPTTAADLPAGIRARWLAADGQYRVEVWPKEVLSTNAAMQRFVDQVRTVAPDASGAVVGWLESGHSVVRAFQHAFAYSIIAITVLLILLLRSVVDMLMVLVPLTLAGLLTVAGAVVFNLPFNFANVIALPLILGVGVDYGVYIVQRGRAAGRTNLLQSSTAKAVLYGALITVANFGNLALSHHPGTRSMGTLLTIGLTMTLLCALLLLPSMIARRYGGTVH